MSAFRAYIMSSPSKYNQQITDYEVIDFSYTNRVEGLSDLRDQIIDLVADVTGASKVESLSTSLPDLLFPNDYNKKSDFNKCFDDFAVRISQVSRFASNLNQSHVKKNKRVNTPVEEQNLSKAELKQNRSESIQILKLQRAKRQSNEMLL